MPDVTYASIVPLIGGESLGAAKALNDQQPEYVLSYSPFAKNDSHYIHYLRNNKSWSGDYIHLDKEPTYKPKYVDIVNATCPCAGLSSLSVKSSSDSAVNDWLYTTARDVLSKISPKVFWGENAPRLSSKSGKPVADKLYEIGKEYGYSLNLYYTESRLHGLCQKRPRTFYFFTKGDRAPIFKTWRREMVPVDDILQKKVLKQDPMNILISENDPNKNCWVSYVHHVLGTKTLKEIHDRIDKTRGFIYEVCAGLYNPNILEIAEWMDSNGHVAAAKKIRYAKTKFDAGKGIWGKGETILKGEIPSLIGEIPWNGLNAYNESYLRIRDCLRIMGMPDDFILLGENPVRNVNHICQNVCPPVAEDMMHGILEYLDGKCEYSNSPYIKQSNKNYSIEDLLEIDIASLDQHFHLQNQ
jgi:site-specific DNA-cytosine methylase